MPQPQRDLTHVDPAAVPRENAVAPLLSTAALALALGGLTAYAQGWLPHQTASLANSVGTWVAVAFALSLRARHSSRGAAHGTVSLVGLVIGYYVTNELRGYPGSMRTIGVWATLAVIVGATVGVCAVWVRLGSGRLAALGGGVLAGLLVGEGMYGLRYVADTTYPAYWWAEIVVGVAVAVAVAAARLRLSGVAIGILVATAAVVSVAFTSVFHLGLPVT